jgi:hypothetical protein
MLCINIAAYKAIIILIYDIAKRLLYSLAGNLCTPATRRLHNQTLWYVILITNSKRVYDQWQM